MLEAPAFSRRRAIAFVATVMGLLILPSTACLTGPLLVEAVGRRMGGALPWLALTACIGWPLVAILAATLLAQNAHRSYRSARIDARGVLFGSSPLSTGARVPWEQIQSFSLVGGGVRLHLQGKAGRWGRWLGPVLPCADVRTHEVVMLLEEHGIPRWDA